MEPRYIIEETKSGFIVKGRPHWLDTASHPQWLIDLAYEESRCRREPVEVRLQRYGLEAVSFNETVRFGFFDYYALMKHVARALLQWWNPPVWDWGRGFEEDFGAFETSCMYKSAVRRCVDSISRRVHAQLRRLLSQVDPVVLNVHKSVFDACRGCRQPAVICEESFYQERYAVQDVLTFRAAAAATLLCEARGSVDETVIERLKHWRDIFAPAGNKAYRALNATSNYFRGASPYLWRILQLSGASGVPPS